MIRSPARGPQWPPFLSRRRSGRSSRVSGRRRPPGSRSSSLSGPSTAGLSLLSSCCSFRLVSVSLGLLLVAVDQLLQDGPQTRGLPLVVLTPCRPHLFASAGVVTPDRSFPGLFALIGIHVSLPSSALNQGVELLLDHLPMRYIHHAPLLCMLIAHPVCNIRLRRWRVLRLFTATSTRSTRRPVH